MPRAGDIRLIPLLIQTNFERGNNKLLYKVMFLVFVNQMPHCRRVGWKQRQSQSMPPPLWTKPKGITNRIKNKKYDTQLEEPTCGFQLNFLLLIYQDYCDKITPLDWNQLAVQYSTSQLLFDCYFPKLRTNQNESEKNGLISIPCRSEQTIKTIT